MRELSKEDYVAMAYYLRSDLGKKAFVGLLRLIGEKRSRESAIVVDQEIPLLRGEGVIHEDFCQTLFKVASSRKAPKEVKLGALRLLAVLPEATISTRDYLNAAIIITRAIPLSGPYGYLMVYTSLAYRFFDANGVCGVCKDRLNTIISSTLSARENNLSREHIQLVLDKMTAVEREQREGPIRGIRSMHQPTILCWCGQRRQEP